MLSEYSVSMHDFFQSFSPTGSWGDTCGRLYLNIKETATIHGRTGVVGKYGSHHSGVEPSRLQMVFRGESERRIVEAL